MSDFSETAYALIVGVGDYTHDQFLDLPATARDAKAIVAVLADPYLCGYSKEKVDLLTGKNATADNIRKSLKKLSQKADTRSTIFIFFSRIYFTTNRSLISLHSSDVNLIGI